VLKEKDELKKELSRRKNPELHDENIAKNGKACMYTFHCIIKQNAILAYYSMIILKSNRSIKC
jgi:hypothetical protein